MNDAEYVFNQTSRERKRDGRGTFNKKRRGGRVIRFPSDNLSKKEKEKMNGEVKTYSFKDPISWKEFMKLPNEMQQEYLDLLGEKFPGVLNCMIAESLGTSANLFNQYIVKHSLKIKKFYPGTPRAAKFKKTEAGIAWEKWNAGKNIAVEKSELHEEEQDEKEELEDINRAIKVDGIDSIIAAIGLLKGTGAKVTIEIVL